MELYRHAPQSGLKRSYESLSNKLSARYKQRTGFDYIASAHQLVGPVIEIAGPTIGGFPIIDHKVPKDPTITNAHTETITGYSNGTFDIMADARRLPFKTDSVGMVLMSCLTFLDERWVQSDDDWYHYTPLAHAEYDLYAEELHYSYPDGSRVNQRISTIEETARVLEPGGLAVWQGATSGDIAIAGMNELALQRWHGKESKFPDGSRSMVYETVLQKS